MTSEAEPIRFRAQRKSTLDSVDQAAGIFSLYGAPRDSWAPDAGDSEIMEEVDEPRERSSGASWAGPLGALRSGDRDSSHLMSVSSSSTSFGPPITITADNSPEKPSRQSLISSDGLERNRLSPSPSPVMGATPMFVNNQSQSSLASTRHPGEEPDAFHVRSTYARLEIDGVYGDGWDEGVERTRERAQAHKRQTLHLSEKGDRVGEKERQILASLDRYGFVMESLKTRSESRLALLPSAPLLKIPKLAQRSSLSGAPRTAPLPTSHGPGGGIEEPPPKAPPSTPPRSSKDKAKETERIGKWEKMLNVQERDEGGNVREWGWNPQAATKLHRRVYKGIPDRWRMAAWWTLIQETAARRSGSKGKQKQNLERLEGDYRHAMDLPSTFDVQIDLDVPRTISGHVMFHTRYGQGQRSLFHVLHCFSMLCPDCGYCQGMGPIAATLLCYFDPERAYALLVEIHTSYNMHSVFAPGFPGLLEAIYVQERLMEFLVPEVYTAFQTHMISGTSYATKWYITLFSNTVPFRTQLRLWDAFFLDGQDVMVLMSFSIIWAFKDSLSSKHANFETILSLLSSYFVPEDEDALLLWIYKMLAQPGFKARLTSWRADWQRLKDTGEADKALL